jgi:hypothetical protein
VEFCPEYSIGPFVSRIVRFSYLRHNIFTNKANPSEIRGVPAAASAHLTSPDPREEIDAVMVAQQISSFLRCVSALQTYWSSDPIDTGAQQDFFGCNPNGCILPTAE